MFKISEKKLLVVLFIFLTLAASFLMLSNLGRAPLEDYDEATYADVTVHSFQGVAKPWFSFFRFVSADSGQQTVPWLDKPPLLLWSMVLSMKTFGIQEFAIRFPSALFGVFLVLCTTALGYVSTKRKTVALFSGLLLLSNHLFLSVSREGRLDGAVVFFAVLSIFFLFLFGERKSQLALFGFWISLALGFLTKTVVVFFPLPFFLIGLFLLKRQQFWITVRQKMHALGLCLFFLIASPWFIAEYFQYGSQFINSFFLSNTINRFSENANGGQQRTFLYYLQILLHEHTMLFVFSSCLLASVFAMFMYKKFRKIKFETDLFQKAGIFGLTSLGILLLLSFSASKLTPYLLSVLPFLFLSFSILAVWLCDEMVVLFQNKKVVQILFVFVCFSMVFLLFFTGVQKGLRLQNTVHEDGLRDEKAIGLLIKQKPQRVYVYLWDSAESLVYYSGQPLAFLEKSASVNVPSPAYLIVPTRFVEKSSFGDTLIYKGNQLSLLSL